MLLFSLKEYDISFTVSFQYKENDRYTITMSPLVRLDGFTQYPFFAMCSALWAPLKVEMHRGFDWPKL